MADRKSDDPQAPPSPPAGPEERRAAAAAGPTSEQLREEIDSGRTGDKVGHPDPAAVPLGADAEAGGAAPGADEVARARSQETARADAPQADPGRPVSTPRGGKSRPLGLIAAVVAVVVVLALVALAFWVR